MAAVARKLAEAVDFVAFCFGNKAAATVEKRGAPYAILYGSPPMHLA